jgi:hypothetical protein
MRPAPRRTDDHEAVRVSRVPKLRAAAVFRKYALRELRAVAWVFAGLCDRDSAQALWRGMARLGGSAPRVPLLRKRGAQCLQLVGPGG